MATFELDSEFVRKLAELLGETGLTEIEYAEGEKRIRLSRAAPAAAVAPVAVAAPVAAAAPAAAPVAAVPPAQHPGAVKSPMVGTAYLAPEPGAGTFVKVGDAVKVGQTLLIIEAMKVMNPIKATKAGTVTQIQVGDAQPVEYGEVLLIIE
ncbi:acetyl-CoA carboxylase biotin carboxyl carrier protein [Nitrospirillum bahiense]|uniref:Biotin carboxyl carrier protein of acetyl-CoA carboxylase n=2 Tax=Nitrospirillum amazonense TaxID=28077 RepID=A0A560FW37_9PROT|nr:acetyl-CoA carboxylase biotin carboxyl carrier protein [Nitrospirillum amazonense]TWB25824.1 acetyl-CoA carboxylase biotin carboxyl carrier protein [Nitrospirillum amazonense]